jgi:hypothetical protein
MVLIPVHVLSDFVDDWGIFVRSTSINVMKRDGELG